MSYNLADRRIDGGYGWIVVAASFFIIVITDGILFSFGNLLIELVEQFRQDRASTAVIGSMMFGIASIIGPFSGGLCDRFGCRIVAVVGAVLSCASLILSAFATSILYLIITYGIVGGTGLGCMFLSANVIVVQYFEKRRGLACGITSTGTGIGTFVFNPFTRFLINEYGWRGAILLEAGMCMQSVVFGLLLLPPPQMKKSGVKTYEKNELINVTEDETSGNEQQIEASVMLTNTRDSRLNDNFETEGKSENWNFENEHTQEESVKQSENCLIRLFKSFYDIKLLANSKLWIFLLSSFSAFLAYTAVLSMAVDRAVQSGMTKNEASWVVSCIGITGTVSRVILGWVADRKNVSRIVMAYVLLFLAGLSTVLSFLLKTVATTFIFATLFGLFTGGYMALCPAVLADLFSAALITKSFGLYMLSTGIAGIAAPPIGGYLHDITGNYDVTFIVAGVELLIAGLLVFVLRFIHVQKRNV